MDIDFNAGLELFGNNKKMYIEVLKSVADESTDKIEKIKKALNEKDYQSYRINVHGIASVSGSIGGEQFMAYARGQEKAAADNDIETVEKNAAQVLERYENLIQKVREYIANA